MQYARPGLLRYNMQDEEDVLDVMHENPSTSTHQISSAPEFHHNVGGKLCIRNCSVHSIYMRHNGCCQGTNISSSQNGCHTRLWALLSMCAACCALTKHINKKGCTQSTQPACMGNGESASCMPLLIPAKIQCQCLGLNHRWLHNRTLHYTGSWQWNALH
jgi:hypothetical protein